MPAKDIYHDTVKRALEKDGWKITKENLQLRWGRKYTYVDLAAEKVFIAEKEGRKIAVEVKSFVGRTSLNSKKHSDNFGCIGSRCGKSTPTASCFWRFRTRFIMNYFLTRTVWN